MKWTADQQNAVDSPVSDILVTAAAGAGKTQVLSGRISKRIENGTDIGSVLVITFTRAAASEMRERIGKNLKEAVMKNPDDERLFMQLSLLGAAEITTIHSFCLNIVRSYFYLLDIDPGFSMADTSESELLLLESIDECMEQLYQKDDPAFLRLVNGLCATGNDNKLRDMIIDLWRHCKSRPFPEVWLAGAARMYTERDIDKTWYIKEIMALAKEDIDGAIKKTALAKSQAEAAENTKFYEMFATDVEFLENIKTALDKDFDTARESLLCPYPKKATVRGEKTKDILSMEALREDAKAQFLHAGALFIQPGEEIIASVNDMAAPIQVLCDAAILLDTIYTEKKRDKNVLDFTDLEQLAVRVLAKRCDDGKVVPSDAALDLRARFEEIYIDEYQDTNLLQETIVRLISRDDDFSPNVFMVGDMKQSIYRFRQTSPSVLFGKKKQTYTEDGPYKKISLTQNFRSHEKVIDAINSAFKTLMSNACGEVDYTDEEALCAPVDSFYEKSDAPHAHLCLVQEQGNSDARLLAEATAVAQKINELLASDTKVYDKELGGYRKIKASDIAILLRVARGKAEAYEDALTNCGVPVFCDVSHDFFESGEVQQFISLLKVIDNPHNDIELICVLRSFLFSYTDEELCDVSFCPGNSFYERLVNKNDEKANAVIQKLSKLKKDSQLVGVSSFLHSLVYKTGFYEYTMSQKNGHIIKKNIELICSLSDKYESSGKYGLFGFIRYLENVRTASDMGEARTVSEDMDAVRIMSIHKSKGLEFPVVFVCGCASKFNLRDMSADMLLHPELGIGIVSVNDTVRAKVKLLPLMCIAEKSRREIISEYMRLFYVALTRAREHLYIVGTTSSYEVSVSSFMKTDNLMPSDIINSQSFLSWIGPVAVHDEANFTVEKLCADEFDTEKEYISRHIVAHTPTDDVRAALTFVYPHLDMCHIPAKLSVSALKEDASDVGDISDADTKTNKFIPYAKIKPFSFLAESEEITPTMRGTLFHYVLENMDINSKNSSDAMQGLNLTERERAAIDTDKLDAFLQSELVSRMRKADKLYREADFTVLLPADMADEKLKKDDHIVLQGIIDCFFFEGDSIVLVDYKTDRCTDPDVILSHYKKQIELYAYALSQKFKKPVTEKYIYLLENCSIIEV